MKVWGSVIAGLLVVVAVLLVVVVVQLNAAAQRDRADRAREICTETIGPVTMENLNEHAECSIRLLP